MKIKFTLLLALLFSGLAFSQQYSTSDFEEDEELAVYNVKDNGNELIINDSLIVTKGGTLKINLPYSRKDFQFVKKKKSGFGKIAKQAAGAVSTGALAVGLGSNSIGTMGGAIRVMQKADAVYYGADALEQIDKLPISKDAKKIAGQEMEVLKWEKDEGMHIITASFGKKKYEITLEAAYVTHEIIIE